MKQVYDLAKALEKDPERMSLALALTQDATRPLMGLRGELGLFGAREWGANIQSGRLKTKAYSGVIEQSCSKWRFRRREQALRQPAKRHAFV